MSETAKTKLRMWIKLLKTTRAAESHLREFVKSKGSTLPRFDVMAELYRFRNGIKMSELSSLLLVSNGNATVVVDRLVSDGLVKRTQSLTDRRSFVVALTKPGVKEFERLAKAHEAEVARIFGHVSDEDAIAFNQLIERVKKR